jgi:hypothetical protein
MIEVRPGYIRASWPMAAAAVILDEEDRAPPRRLRHLAGSARL